VSARADHRGRDVSTVYKITYPNGEIYAGQDLTPRTEVNQKEREFTLSLKENDRAQCANGEWYEELQCIAK
jgi:hypothetical protein